MTVAAHLIVGARDEPFLGAMLESIAGAVDTLIVNENSGLAHTANLVTLEASRFAREGRIAIDRTTFTDFATARNRTLAVHRERDAGEWFLLVDADEVHHPSLGRIASRLGALDAGVGFVDGYHAHFFQSFDWYLSIDRHPMFIRYAPSLHWSPPVHERLEGATGRRIALPYVFAHYGWVLSARRQAEKARVFSSLGAPGEIVAEADLASVEQERYFAPLWPIALRYHGRHPVAALPAIASLRAQYRAEFAATPAIVARHQHLRRRLANAIRRLNFAYRWRARALDPRTRVFVRALGAAKHAAAR